MKVFVVGQELPEKIQGQITGFKKANNVDEADVVFLVFDVKKSDSSFEAVSQFYQNNKKKQFVFIFIGVNSTGNGDAISQVHVTRLTSPANISFIKFPPVTDVNFKGQIKNLNDALAPFNKSQPVITPVVKKEEVVPEKPLEEKSTPVVRSPEQIVESDDEEECPFFTKDDVRKQRADEAKLAKLIEQSENSKKQEQQLVADNPAKANIGFFSGIAKAISGVIKKAWSAIVGLFSGSSKKVELVIVNVKEKKSTVRDISLNFPLRVRKAVNELPEDQKTYLQTKKSNELALLSQEFLGQEKEEKNLSNWLKQKQLKDFVSPGSNPNALLSNSAEQDKPFYDKEYYNPSSSSPNAAPF